MPPPRPSPLPYPPPGGEGRGGGRRAERKRVPRKLRPDLWVSPKPYGLGEVKPNHYAEIAKTVWENRSALPYAWRILSKGVCDGCALGVAGFHDWTIEGVHLCTTRLNLLRVNTMGPLDPAALTDVSWLRGKSGAELRDLGRLPYPMLRRRGEPGFERISWDRALDLVAGGIQRAGPDRIGFYLTARGLTNEVYYVAQKVVRFLGSNNIDNAARVCHAPSTATLKAAIGVGATTISYSDLFDADLVVLFGSDVANSQPVVMKYLYLARKGGTKVAVVNPYREPGLERYWVPSNVESALFGTKMADEFFQVHTGGDIAFINGVLKAMAVEGLLDREFIDHHTVGFGELWEELARTSFQELEQFSGASQQDMARFARLYGGCRSAIFIWSMGITQHAFGSDNVRAIINLALARGNVGRPGAGLMPIRGHSGVQGGAEMGAYATVLPGPVPVTPEAAARLSARYGFDVKGERGLSATEMVEAAHAGELEVLYSSGGNFLEVLPDRAMVREALERVPLRVHQDIVVSSQMLVDPGREVVLLPAATRYEQREGGTETTTERRIVFSPEIPGPRLGEARTEWEIFLDLARRVDPERAHLVHFDSGWDIRREIAEVVPMYAGIESLAQSGDQVQWGGPRLCEGWQFPTPDGRARFSAVSPPEASVPEGKFLLSTRRGKQFNSMVFSGTDPLTGARRSDVLVSPEDAQGLGVADGDRVLIRSEHGEMEALVKTVPIKPGNVQMFWPEANVLIPPGVRDPEALIPDYNAVVEVLPLGSERSHPLPAQGGGRDRPQGPPPHGGGRDRPQDPPSQGGG
ncbi:MAG: FdhF/YdeP family oxidoreductase [Acidimicrobiia bacterium]